MDAAERAEIVFQHARRDISMLAKYYRVRIDFSDEFFQPLEKIPAEILRLDVISINISNTSISSLDIISQFSDLHELILDGTPIKDFSALKNLRSLRWLDLDRTAIKDLNPLADLTNLHSLFLDDTRVSDLSPLQNLKSLENLSIQRTQVSDLRPISSITGLISVGSPGLRFDETLAVANDSRLKELKDIVDHDERARQTLAYLRSLPPWPEPYTPAATPDGSPPKPIGGDALVEQAKALSEKTPLAEELVQDPKTGLFSVRHKAIEKPDLLSATLGQVADAIEDVLYNPSNGLNEGSLEIRKLRRTLDRHANDPQRVEMDFTTIHQSLTRQVAIGDLPPSEATLALMNTLQDAAQGIRATDPAVAVNRKILQEQKLREMPAEALGTLRDAKPILEAMTEGDLNAQMQEDLQFLTEEMRAGPPSLPGVTRDEAILGGRDEAVRVFGRSARMFIAIKKSPSLIHRLHDSAAFKAGVVAKALADLIKWGLSFF